MPDVIDDDDSDALAAEFVLGTLDADERTHANLLLDIDDSFRGKVRVWESRLGELHLMVEPVEPAPQILERIKAKMEGASPKLAAAAPGPKPRSKPEAKPEPGLKSEPASAPTEPLPPAEPALEQSASSEGGDITEDIEAKDSIDSNKRLDATLDEIEAELRKVGNAGHILTPAGERPPDLFPNHPGAEPVGEPLADDVAVRQADTVARDQGARERKRLAPSFVPDSGKEDLRPALRRWRAVAVMMIALVLAVGGLLATWRYAPDRLPPPLRATTLLHIDIPPPPPQKPKAPPESVFDE